MCVCVLAYICACLHIIESMNLMFLGIILGQWREECVNDDEESLIQSFVNEEAEGPSLSLCYSSRADPYATITYTNLRMN